jgi:hypothetical protein
MIGATKFLKSVIESYRSNKIGSRSDRKSSMGTFKMDKSIGWIFLRIIYLNSSDLSNFYVEH